MHNGAECCLHWDTALEMSAWVLISSKAAVHNISSVSRPYSLKFSTEDATKVTSKFPVYTWYLTDAFKSSIIFCYPGHHLNPWQTEHLPQHVDPEFSKCIACTDTTCKPLQHHMQSTWPMPIQEGPPFPTVQQQKSGKGLEVFSRFCWKPWKRNSLDSVLPLKSPLPSYLFTKVKALFLTVR